MDALLQITADPAFLKRAKEIIDAINDITKVDTIDHLRMILVSAID